VAFDRLIITVALCGAEVTREKTPYIPITPEELSDEAKNCAEAGASIVHLHVRDSEGKPTQDRDIFSQTVGLIRQKAPELVVQVSTGGAVWMDAETRIQSLDSNPDMATLTTGTSNFGNDVFLNPPKTILTFAREMEQRKIMPEFECFDMGHLSYALYLIQRRIVQRPHYHFDFVLGVPGAIAANVPNLVQMAQSLPQPWSWTVAGIGRAQFPLAAVSIAMGGHVRVGMEDNLFLEKGVLAKSNAEMVDKAVRIARELGRPIASPSQVRDYFQIQ
jgi:3-keto-5-aminohexanoate cleavage enzyme